VSKRKKHARLCTTVLGFFVLVVILGSLPGEPAPAAADAEPPDAKPPAAAPADAGQWLQKFSEPYPADEGALTWDDLDDAEKEAAARADEWAQTQHGHEVHQRWRRASREGARLSRLKRAEYTSGLAGLEGLGVE
jgi:hypothetical protein